MRWPSPRKKAITGHANPHVNGTSRGPRAFTHTSTLWLSQEALQTPHPLALPFAGSDHTAACSITDVIWTWLGNRGLSRCASVYIHRLWVTAAVCLLRRAGSEVRGTVEHLRVGVKDFGIPAHCLGLCSEAACDNLIRFFLSLWIWLFFHLSFHS